MLDLEQHPPVEDGSVGEDCANMQVSSFRQYPCFETVSRSHDREVWTSGRS